MATVSPPQPALMKNDFALKLTIGILTGEDHVELVESWATDDTSLTDSNRALNLLTAYDAVMIPKLLAVMGAQAAVRYIQAEGAIDGIIPSRYDYGPTTNVGTATGDAIPNNVCGLLVYYSDPSDIPAGDRIRVAKNFIPGMTVDTLMGGVPSNAYKNNLETYGAAATDGTCNNGMGTPQWYRVVSLPPRTTPSTNVIRAGSYLARRYVGTQRRRLLPRS